MSMSSAELTAAINEYLAQNDNDGIWFELPDGDNYEVRKADELGNSVTLTP